MRLKEKIKESARRAGKHMSQSRIGQCAKHTTNSVGKHFKRYELGYSLGIGATPFILVGIAAYLTCSQLSSDPTRIGGLKYLGTSRSGRVYSVLESHETGPGVYDREIYASRNHYAIDKNLDRIPDRWINIDH